MPKRDAAPRMQRTSEKRRGGAHRRGMTLLELLIASSMLLLLAGVIGGLASAVQTASDYSEGLGTTAQHARVALERMTRDVNQATAIGDYPGFAVMYEDVGGIRFPDTLLVWRPSTAPFNRVGPPLVSELVIYCPNPQKPSELLEITASHDARPIALNDESVNQSPWREMIAGIKADPQAQRVVLTNMLRTVPLALTSQRRSCVRFSSELSPSTAELEAYRNSTLAWNELAWPQGLYSTQTGVRKAALRIELQLVPAGGAETDAVPFFESASLYYQVRP